MYKKGNYNNLVDEEIVGLVLEKDKNWYEVLVRRYEKKITAYVSYYISQHDNAIEVTQTTFIKAYVNLRSFNYKLKFSSWLYRIAHNEAINFIRKYQKEVSSDENKVFDTLLDDTVDFESVFENKEQKQLILQILDRLPVKYRDVLVLYFFEDRSYEDISNVLRISIGTVGTRINRGKKIMKKLLTERRK